jgi:hypothetical protein
MKFIKINNNSNMDLADSEELFHSLGQYAQEQFGFKRPPTLNLISDRDNHMKPLGKTAYYDPEGMTVSIYVDGRHPKDILRSFAHELVHHAQNENGELRTGGYHGEGYAQKNKNLRNMERDAYERGNMCFRDWEDQLKQEKPTIYNERRNYKMSIKDWKNKELNENLNRKWGFKMDLTKLNESKDHKVDPENKHYKQGHSDGMTNMDEDYPGVSPGSLEDFQYGEGYKDGKAKAHKEDNADEEKK